MAGATLLAALAILAAVLIERIDLNPWLLLGLLAGAILTAILRAVRRASLAVLEGSPILALWLLSRFTLTPALFLLAVILIGSLPFRTAATDTLLEALLLLGFCGAGIFFATAILADLAAVIRSPGRGRPSDS